MLCTLCCRIVHWICVQLVNWLLVEWRLRWWWWRQRRRIPKKPWRNHMRMISLVWSLGFSFQVIYIKDNPKVINTGVAAATEKHMLRQFQWNWFGVSDFKEHINTLKSKHSRFFTSIDTTATIQQYNRSNGKYTLRACAHKKTKKAQISASFWI